MSWFQLQGIEAELAVVHDIAGNQRDSLEMVERLVSAGSAHEFDRLRAEALLHNVEAAGAPTSNGAAPPPAMRWPFSSRKPRRPSARRSPVPPGKG